MLEIKFFTRYSCIYWMPEFAQREHYIGSYVETPNLVLWGEHCAKDHTLLYQGYD